MLFISRYAISLLILILTMGCGPASTLILPTPNSSSPPPTTTPPPPAIPVPTPLPTPTPTRTTLPTAVHTPTPPVHDHNIKVVIDTPQLLTECITITKQALDLLASKSPPHYEMVRSSVGTIECSVAPGSLLRVKENPVRVIPGSDAWHKNRGIEWYAGMLVHLACHSMAYKELAKDNSSPSEEQWLYHLQVEAKCLDVQDQTLRAVGAGPESLALMELYKDPRCRGVLHDHHAAELGWCLR